MTLLCLVILNAFALVWFVNITHWMKWSLRSVIYQYLHFRDMTSFKEMAFLYFHCRDITFLRPVTLLYLYQGFSTRKGWGWVSRGNWDHRLKLQLLFGKHLKVRQSWTNYNHYRHVNYFSPVYCNCRWQIIIITDTQCLFLRPTVLLL